MTSLAWTVTPAPDVQTPMRPRVVATIQVRMGSTRLPGKALLPIHGRAVIGRIFDRLSYCKSLDSIVVACPDTKENDVIEAFCTREGIGCFRGPEQNLTARLTGAADHTSAQALVRITADCPLVDHGLVDQCVEMWRSNPYVDYVSNVYPTRTFPDGLDVEVISRQCLELLGVYPELENLTSNIWKTPLRFRIMGLTCKEGNLGHLRWTLDRVSDWPIIVDAWGALPESFTWLDILDLYRKNTMHYEFPRK